MLVLTSGMIVADVVAVLPKIASPGEMVHLEEDIVLRDGGHPGNIVVDLAKLGVDPNQLGTVIAVGTDPFGYFLTKNLQNHGIKYFAQRIRDRQTSIDIVLVKKGEDRRFHVSPGANLALEPEFLRQVLKQAKPQIFCVRPGYSGIDLKIKEILREFNGFKFLDICRPYQKEWNYILPAVEEVHVLHCNTKEAMGVTGKTTPEQAIEDLRQRVKEFLCITEGEKGARLITKDKQIWQPAFEVEWIDPTGCGDAFCAGVIYKILEKRKFTDFTQEELADILRFGQAVGAAASLALGCTAGIERKKVDKILRTQQKKI